MKTYDELMEINKQTIKNLNSNNYKYYEDVLSYMRNSGFTKDKREIEEVLYELLTDLLQAQSQGVSAIEYFGKNPKKMSDEILKNIKTTPKKKLIITISNMLFTTVMFINFTYIIKPDEGMDIGMFILSNILFVSFLFVFMKLAKTVSFLKNKIIALLILGLFLLIYLLSCFILITQIKEVYKIYLYGNLGIAVSVILSIILYIYNKQYIDIDFSIMIFSTLVLSILTRLNITNEFFKTLLGETIIFSIKMVAPYLCIAFNKDKLFKSKKVN